MNNSIINASTAYFDCAQQPLSDRTDKQISSLFQRIEHLSDKIENSVRTPKSKFGGEHYLTDKEVVKLLKISKRTLQDYRLGGELPFYRIGAKVLYRASDIDRFLESRFQNRQTGKHFTHT